VSRRLLLLLAVAGALVWLTGAPAAAHASLLRTDPQDGSVVATTPQQVVLTFNEPIRLPDSAVKAFRPDGSAWKVSAEVTDNRLVVTPGEDPGSGTVVVAWKVISADGHIVGGALTFSIGAPSDGGAAAAGGASQPPRSVSVLRWLAAGVAGLGLLACVGLDLARRRTDLVWNAGFGAAVLLAPLHQLVDDHRGLDGLGDWLVWIDGVTRPSSLLLLAAYAVLAAARSASRRTVAVVVAVPALVLLGGAAYSWPRADHGTAPPAAVPVGPATGTALLGTFGSVRLTTQREAGRAVSIEVLLLDPQGRPLTPYAPPTVTIGSSSLSLGDATLTSSGPGAYRAEVTIPTDGSWQAQVSVRTSEYDNPIAVVPFVVGGGASPDVGSPESH
jgi:methionine-rich copper-binding protein CopC